MTCKPSTPETQEDSKSTVRPASGDHRFRGELLGLKQFPPLKDPGSFSKLLAFSKPHLSSVNRVLTGEAKWINKVVITVLAENNSRSPSYLVLEAKVDLVTQHKKE